METTHLEVFRHKPRLKCREEERSCNAAQNTTQHQNFVLRRMLGDAAQYVCNTVSHTCSLPTSGFALQGVKNQEITVPSKHTGQCMKFKGRISLFVGQRPHDCPKQHGRSKPCNEELPNLAFGEPILTVQKIHIGAL